MYEAIIVGLILGALWFYTGNGIYGRNSDWRRGTA